MTDTVPRPRAVALNQARQRKFDDLFAKAEAPAPRPRAAASSRPRSPGGTLHLPALSPAQDDPAS